MDTVVVRIGNVVTLGAGIIIIIDLGLGQGQGGKVLHVR